jgi:Ca-activated chloride channel family protein
VLWALPFFLAAMCVVPGHAQTVPPGAADEPGATISVEVRLVVLDASVRDKDGGIVSGLQEWNFKAEENGQPQNIEGFLHEDIPVEVGPVVDNSGSMQGKRAEFAETTVAFARSSNPGDEMFIVNFNEQVALGLPDTKLFSASASELEDALLKPVPAGKTALYEAITAALAHLQKSSSGRKALVVITDGGDNASRHTLNEVLEDIGRSDVTIYTIGLFDPEDTDRNSGVLRRIANASGGEAFLPTMPAQAVRICERIAKDIRSQYTISYSSSNQDFDGGYRASKVTVTGDHGTKLRVRTRAGYIASPDGTPAPAVSEEGRR